MLLRLRQNAADKAQHGGVCQLVHGGGEVLHKAQRVAGQVLNIHSHQLHAVLHHIPGHDRGRRHVHNAAQHHRAGLAALDQQLVAAGVDLLHALIPVGYIFYHREHDPQVAVRGGAQQRPDLRLEQPVAAQAVLRLPGPGGVVVGAGIAGAQQHGHALGAFQQLAQTGGLHLVALVVQNRGLGAHKADARRAARMGHVAVADVAGRHQAEGRAVLRQAGQGGHGVGLLAVQAAQCNFTVRLGDLRTVRLHNKRAVVGVKDRTVAHGHGRSAAAQLYHRRDAHAAGHDGGMADRAVLVAGQPQHHAAVQTEQVTGEEAVRHQDAGALQMQAAARASVQNIHHAAADVADIDAALPDVLIIDVFQAARKNLLGALDGGSPARTGGNIVTDLVREGLVLQQGDLEQQNIRVRPLGALAQTAQLVLSQHDGDVVEGTLPERVANDAVQAGGAVVDLLNRADHNAGGRRYAGIGVHRMPPFFFLAPSGRGVPQGRMRGGFAADTR